jgi:hypothetical protein
MNWNRLIENRCPQCDCDDPLKDIHRSHPDYPNTLLTFLACWSCPFRIRKKKRDELVDSMHESFVAAGEGPIIN